MRKMIFYRIAQIIVLVIFLPIGGIMCKSQVNTQSNSSSGQLEVSLLGDINNPILKIELFNTGQSPFFVDKELVCPLEVFVFDSSNEEIYLDEIQEVKRPIDSDIKKRIISLAPNNSVIRLVDLKRGFKRFITGISIPENGIGNVGPMIMAYESIYRIPDNLIPSRIEVYYNTWYSFNDGFKEYTKNADIPKIYTGPLKSTILYKFN